MRARRVVYARQGTAKVHVLGGRVDEAACGALLTGDEYLARLVPLNERCQSAGCRVRWPAMLRAVS